MSPSAVIHNFAERLEYSAGLSDEPTWVEFYKTIWPSLLCAVRVDKDSKWQRWGVDRIVLLPGGREFRIDEKKRERSKKTGQLYDDFLLEELSDVDRRKVGWSLDPDKRCDFIAYAIPELAKCYLLPFELLRLTCARNLYRWKVGSPKLAINNGWTTRNWAVSWPQLFAAMEEEMKRQFSNPQGLDLPAAKVFGPQQVFEWGKVQKEAE